MKHVLRIIILVLVMGIVVGGGETAVATQQTLSGQDALNFLQETGIYSQLAAETSSSFSPEGREFFPLQPIDQTLGETDDLFGISVAVDGDTALVGVSSDDVDGTVDQGSVYVQVFVDGSWPQQAQLIADDGAADDLFGFAVALDGDTALVGAYQADIGGNNNQGAAYIFKREGFFWSQAAKLVATNGAAGDEFGRAVALDGGVALIGASSDDVNGNVDQGATYVFTQSGSSWNQTAVLTSSDTVAGDGFGYSVALDGLTALIGAPFEDIGFDENQGAAYVFTGSGSSWSQEGRLVTGDGAEDDQLGGAVALNGDTAVVGAHLADINGTSNHGAAYVYTRSGGSWSQQAKLTADDGAQGDRLGRSVAVAGDTVLLGAPRANINGNGDQGAAYVFIRDGGGWSQQSKLTDWINGEGGDRFGRSVALDGDAALVGAIYAQLPIGNADRGVVYPFARSPVPWLPEGQAVAADGDEANEFGYSVAVDGNRALVGAPLAEVNGNGIQGAAYIFERSSNNWVQTAKLIDTVFAEWRFGYSVALEGDVAVVGAPGSDSGIDLGGAVYIFVRESGNNWIQYEMLTTPIRNNQDRFGYSVALDGGTVLVGAPGKDIDGNDDQGAAYVFIRESNSSWIQQATLLALDGAEDEEFGSAVALDGDTALVGAYLAEIDGKDNQGAAYVFTKEGDIWTHQTKLIATDGAVSDWFGYSVALEGNTALVGAYLADVNGHANQGKVYYFARTGNSWSQQAKLTATDGGIDDRFGNAIALEGNTVLVGAHLADVDGNSQQGAVYVFANMGTDGWQQQTRLTAGNGVASDEFGSSVALGGSTALVGAPKVDGGGNEDEGKVYFFQRQPYEVFLPLIVR